MESANASLYPASDRLLTPVESAEESEGSLFRTLGGPSSWFDSPISSFSMQLPPRARPTGRASSAALSALQMWVKRFETGVHQS